MTLDQIVRALARRRKVADWSVQTVEQRGSQRFLVGAETEARRSVRSITYPVTIFHDHVDQHGVPSRGSSSLSILPDGSNLVVALDEAMLMAAAVNNRPYGLPGPAAYPDVPLVDPGILERPDELAAELAAELRDAVFREAGVELSSGEIFLESREVELRNSRGVHGRSVETSVLLEFVLLAGRGAGQMEAHTVLERRRLADIDLPELVERTARHARDMLRTTMPRTLRGPVLLRDRALADLLGNEEANGVLSFHTSAAAKYRDLSRLEVGLPVSGELPIEGDRLCYHGSSVLPYGTYSAPFDGEGLPGADLRVIDDGVLVRRWASQRYADYMNIPATGAFGNAIIPPGAHALDDLRDACALQIVAFSWMNPDPVTGDFVAEIRLGYERHGAEWQPIRGGSLSGNIFAALANIRLSRETGFFGHYQGPAAALFGDLTVSGE
jgi:predicted Zn-dependent protease